MLGHDATVIGQVLPNADSAYDLGTAALRWDGLYVGSINVEARITMSTWTADGDTAVYKDDPTGAIGVQASDVRLKKNLENITGALDIISGLNAYKFHMIDESDNDTKRLGVIAQELLPSLPELTFNISNDEGEQYYGVHYDKLPVLLLAGLKEQQAYLTVLTDVIREVAPEIYSQRLGSTVGPHINNLEESQQPDNDQIAIDIENKVNEALIEILSKDLVLNGTLTINNELIVTGSMNVYQDLQVDALLLADTIQVLDSLEVQGKATFLSDVWVEGDLIRDNEQLGTATLPQDASIIRITFTNPFSSLDAVPVITLIPERDIGSFWITERDATGFTINLKQPLEDDTIIAWTALTQTEQNTVTTSVIEETEDEESTPTPTPTPILATPVPYPELEPSISPTLTPTPSISPSPIITPSPTPSNQP